jgi:hypothetical protein
MPKDMILLVAIFSSYQLILQPKPVKEIWPNKQPLDSNIAYS